MRARGEFLHFSWSDVNAMFWYHDRIPFSTADAEKEKTRFIDDLAREQKLARDLGQDEVIVLNIPPSREFLARRILHAAITDSLPPNPSPPSGTA
jgi:hypothetical protein